MKVKNHQSVVKTLGIVKIGVLCELQDKSDGNLFTGQMAIGVEVTGA